MTSGRLTNTGASGPGATSAHTTRDLALAGLFAALTAVSAYVSFPLLGPVPFSLQTLVVVLAGIVLGPGLGALGMIVYVLLGLVAPVYAGGAMGAGVLMGPHGGYLVGFVVGAAVAGFAVRAWRPSTFWGFAGAAALGLVPIYGLGAMWLAVSLGTVEPAVVLWGGVVQFLPGELIKVAAAALIARSLVAAPIDLPALARGR